jgi:hypothetical protein
MPLYYQYPTTTRTLLLFFFSLSLFHTPGRCLRRRRIERKHFLLQYVTRLFLSFSFFFLLCRVFFPFQYRTKKPFYLDTTKDSQFNHTRLFFSSSLSLIIDCVIAEKHMLKDRWDDLLWTSCPYRKHQQIISIFFFFVSNI